MSLSKFIGREAELARLKGLLDNRSASLIVVRGRRRIGKSRLLSEFGKGMRSLFFSGIPPSKKTTAQSQRDEFAYQIERIDCGWPTHLSFEFKKLMGYIHVLGYRRNHPVDLQIQQTHLCRIISAHR